MTAGVVIVGTGVAGAGAALALRKEGYRGGITVVGREPLLPYRRPVLSKEILTAAMPIEKALIKPDAHWAEQDVTLRTGVTVDGGDPAAHTVALSDGTTLEYDTLLLTTGSRSRHLPDLPPGDRVAYLRDHEDAVALRDRLAGSDAVTILGSGLIGSEIASAAEALGVQATIVEAAALPLARVVPPVLGERLAKLQRDHGVDLLLGRAPDDVVVDTDGVTVTVGDRSLRSDLLVVAVGTVPDTVLAEKLGAATDNGIVVDDRFRTDLPDVYAAGDAASLPHPLFGGQYRAENWTAAQDQGGAAAKAILGGLPAPTVPWGWSKQFGVLVQFAGWPSSDCEIDIAGSVDEGKFVARCMRGGELVGAVALDDARGLTAARQELGARVVPAPQS
ncbi:FAD-dependent oxidoreductase [Tsukamurella sp. 8F]|uniref:NAD(P)/FAD-dependent oxidoreductase n=1 Tax=unclassified Tsukamurella TaxID=2633480 RepID=UPI0023BA11DF|nr:MULTISPECIES: FAD-dependent oxidoreductase [unclassified Tsukamurella]MDF0530003.1 FAD-dependent oxidoreductase [Tsukamurella sp. 8J]MDF0587225.1 FAD-dependent oxidoreductase [Tsukamurella sp. 8F]